MSLAARRRGMHAAYALARSGTASISVGGDPAFPRGEFSSGQGPRREHVALGPPLRSVSMGGP